MNRYALFFDIDGTLVSFQTHRIPDSTVEALERAKTCGHRIYIATGRPMAIVNNLSQIEHLIDGYITTNGAYSFVGDELVACNPIPREDVDYALAEAKAQDFAMIISGRQGFGLWNAKPIVKQLFVDGLGVDADTLSLDVDAALQGEVLELTPFVTHDQELRLMAGMPASQSARWHPLFCDVTSKQADKGQALLAMARHEGFALEQTIAFGDGGNDISIVKTAGIGVAMGNANEELKAVADYVTTAVDEDGIMNALKKFEVI